MSDNEPFQLVITILTLAHACVLAWAVVLRRGLLPLLLLNLVFSGAVLVYLAPLLPNEIAYIARGAATELSDFQTPILCLFEFAVLVAAGLALSSVRVPAAVTWISFAINFCISIGALLIAFFLQFKCCGYL